MFENRLTSEAELRAVYRPPNDAVVAKCHPSLDAHARAHIDLSPFVIIGTSAPDGTADVSPKGGPPGFVTVLDDRHLAIGDLSGNNLLDTLTNIAAGSGVGIIFLVPGNEVTLRVNGHACITTDDDVLDACAVKDRRPKTAIGVTVTEQFVHCAKAFRRSGLWDPSSWPAEGSLASLGAIVSDGMGLDAEAVPAVEEMLEQDYAATLWKPGGDD
jgi:PPOX class probable FMN-dependent enzyme